MITIIWSITLLAQLFCLYKVFTDPDIGKKLYYRNLVFAWGVCGICAAALD